MVQTGALKMEHLSKTLKTELRIFCRRHAPCVMSRWGALLQAPEAPEAPLQYYIFILYIIYIYLYICINCELSLRSCSITCCTDLPHPFGSGVK